MCIMPGEMEDRVDGVKDATEGGKCPKCGKELHISFWVTMCENCGWKPGCHPDDHEALARIYKDAKSKR